MNKIIDQRIGEIKEATETDRAPHALDRLRLEVGIRPQAQAPAFGNCFAGLALQHIGPAHTTENNEGGFNSPW